MSGEKGEWGRLEIRDEEKGLGMWRGRQRGYGDRDCGARGFSIVNPQQQVAMIGFLPPLDGNWRTRGTL
jgi:hypothetical protein